MTLRTVGADAELCLPEIEEWIQANLPSDYDWPGNYQEDEFFARFRAGGLTADEVLARYAAQVLSIDGEL